MGVSKVERASENFRSKYMMIDRRINVYPVTFHNVHSMTSLIKQSKVIIFLTVTHYSDLDHHEQRKNRKRRGRRG